MEKQKKEYSAMQRMKAYILKKAQLYNQHGYRHAQPLARNKEAYEDHTYAYMIDLCVALLPALLWVFVFILIICGILPVFLLTPMYWITLVLLVVTSFGLTGWFSLRSHGLSFGRFLIGLKVVRKNNKEASPGVLLLREIIEVGIPVAVLGYFFNVLGMLAFWFLNVIVAIASPGQRTIADWLLGTRVIYEPHVNIRFEEDVKKEMTVSTIDLHIHSGETIGIIGGTGCGKSSLVNLISRLYDVSEGTVRVGGKDVRSYDMEALRNNVAVVLQKNVLFSGTIYDNLRWGNETATDEECVAACKAACADEFIEQLPQKYDTWIERGGTNVSGGQKQRLCIARALLKKPKILILDDSTSAVDTATDAKIRKAFKEAIPGTTKIIIAQRVSSVEDADRIIVMDNGKINGIGSHEELMNTNEIYREIYESQKQSGGDFDQAS